jgi:hypothetical protein
MAGTRQAGRNRELINTTASITLSPNDAGKTITNYGAVGAVAITLPTATQCRPGDDVLVLGAANQTLTVSPATADTLVGLHDLDLDSVALQTASEMIGGGLWFTCLGPVWHVMFLTEETQTVTAAD